MRRLPVHAWRRNPLAKAALQLPPLRCIVVREQGDRLATAAHPACSTDPVRQEIGRFRQLVVDDEIDRRDIDPARGDIGGEEDGHLAGPEIGHDGIAGVLREVALQRRNRITGRCHLLGQFAHAVLGPPEDDDLTVPAGIEQIAQGVQLAATGHVVNDVINLLGFRLGRSDRDVGRTLQVAMAGIIHPLGHGRREEGGLPIFRGPAEDLVDLRRKSAIEHLISFIENQEADPVQYKRTLLIEIGDAARGTDHDLGAPTELLDLGTKCPATVDQCNLDTSALGQIREDRADLNGQLPGWGQDKHLDGAKVGIDRFDGRNTEGEGFAGTGPGLANDIASGQKEGKGLGLDLRRDGDIHPAKGIVRGLAHGEIGEGRHRLVENSGVGL